ncbi:bifunctional diguanylate cyclase/phosphodiesterase [Marinomonas transparens]|uniref:EAL domain-containing protein n=1 Tax=Marinomonas transparens TaxID=2795388 RepID=A0A934JXR5_9GAMM|nr:EAL domain-containing protein [Marinomonas transparens]MBJ7538887.1 EAL domain-containing protein [Marinomonas transparens]
MVSSEKHTKSRKIHLMIFLLVFICGVIISAAVYLEERKQVLIDQKASGYQFTEKLQENFNDYVSELSAMAALIQFAPREIIRSDFSRFARTLMSTPSANVYFAQYVPADKKDEYERQQRVLTGSAGFSIFPVGEREEYLPLTLSYPEMVPYGFDILSSHYQNVESVIRSRTSHTVQLSKPIVLPFQDKYSIANPDTLMLKMPVYLPAELRSYKVVDNMGFFGIVGAYFTVERLLKQVVLPTNNGLIYRIADTTTKKTDPIWFADSHILAKASFASDESVWKEGAYNTQYLNFADREWRIDTRYFSDVSSFIRWDLVFGPLVFFGLLAFFLAHYVRKLSQAYLLALNSANKRIEVDELTGLLSRYQIQQVLSALIEDCRKDKKRFATLFLDLDHFKTINDAFGHETGDQLLAKVAQRLTSLLPDDVNIGYLGGDTFLVLVVLDEEQDESQLHSLAKEIILQISQSYFVEERTLNIGCSIGVALYPEFGLDAVTLIKNADMAVYEAKTAGRATYHFYDGEMGKRFARNVRIETRLRQALQNDVLELHFQPKVDLLSERCVGMEALLRWNDEELGAVSPAEFVPIAEHTGIILALGDWVFEQAFRHILEWQEQGVQVPPIAINCSAAQLRRPDFLSKLLALLDQYKVDPSLLEIEVTESILIKDAEGCAELLRQISRLGIKLAIDDFGTGYSSLSYLKDLPFDYVKIDQVFIRDIIEDKNHAILTKAIIGLSHDLNLKVIAEGITNIEQLIYLQEFGCDIGQGYFFSKALGANSMSSDPMIVALNEQDDSID